MSRVNLFDTILEGSHRFLGTYLRNRSTNQFFFKFCSKFYRNEQKALKGLQFFFLWHRITDAELRAKNWVKFPTLLIECHRRAKSSVL